METGILQSLRKEFRQCKLRHSMPERHMLLSSVAIILRINPCVELPRIQGDLDTILQQLAAVESVWPQTSTQNFYELLFLQRVISPKDSNPGQLCFPGGKCDAGESDYSAVLRETTQETGVCLDEKLLLGKLPRAFFARKRKGQYLFLTVYVFLHLNQQQQIHLNAEEMMDFRWVGLKDLLMSEHSTQLKIAHRDVLLEMAVGIAKEFGTSSEEIERSFEGAYFPAIDLGMSLPLFGLTLFVWIEVAKTIVRTCSHLIPLPMQQKVELMIARSMSIRFRFSKDLERHKQISARVQSEYYKLRIIPDNKVPRL